MKAPPLSIRGAVGGAIGGAIVILGLAKLQAWGIERTDESTFKRELARLESEISDRIAAAQWAAAEHYAMWPDKPIYLALPLHLSYLTQVTAEDGQPLMITNLVGVDIAPGPAPIYSFPLESPPKLVSVDVFGSPVYETTLPIPIEFHFGSPGEREAFLEAVKARREEFARREEEFRRPLVNIQIAPREDPVRKSRGE